MMRPEDGNNTQPWTDPYRQGLRLYRQGRYDQAAEVLSTVPERSNLAGAVARYYQGLSHRALGAQAVAQGDLTAAERHLAAAAGFLGREGDLPGYLACLYARTGRLDACLRQTDKALATGGADVRTWLRHAQAQWRTGRRDEAQMTLREGLRRLGDQVDLHNQAGLFLAAQGRWPEAREAFARAVQADCSRPAGHENLGLAAAATHDCRAALRSLQRAYELRPNDMVLAHRLALAAKAVAGQDEQVVIRLPESQVRPLASQMVHLAHYVTVEGEFVDAFLALPPSDVDAELFAVLEAALQTAIARHGDYADLHLRASAVLERMGRPEEALGHARAAVDINGRYVRARLHLGKLCAAAGLDDEAVEHLEQAIAQGADWADVHCLAADLLASGGRTAKAKRHLRRALKLNPGYPRAAKALASLAA
ncbi:MAG: tetratricopeptide repeat protein [Phycisphaerae bacterium]|nr:tetratricopeptide repeat protein [Phycisphaerae bacterium]